MDKYGVDINPKIKAIASIEQELRCLFVIQQDELLLQAASDSSKFHNIQFPLNDVIDALKGETLYGYVNYSKKERRFDFIQYTVKGKLGGTYAKRFLI